MSNSPILATSEIASQLKSQYLDLIAKGYSEHKALTELNFPRGLYLKLLTDDKDFVIAIEGVRKLRADYWVSKIADSADHDYSKDEVASERLKFDKLQFLARADNPEKYGNNNKKVDISIDLKQFKLLPPEEAVRALANDPFAIEADYVEVKEDEELL